MLFRSRGFDKRSVGDKKNNTAEKEEEDDDIGRKTLTWKKDREEGEGETKG